MGDRKVYDRILIDPDADALDAVLGDARAIANEGNDSKSKHLAWPPADLSEVIQRIGTVPDGLHGWHGGKKAKYYAGKSQVTVAWWTNMLGEKHVRVLGGHGLTTGERLHIGETGQFHGGTPLSYAELLYPEVVARVLKPGGEPALVGVCPCGAVGSFQALGWTGPCCGPCRDHQQEGHTLPVRSWGTDIRYGPSLTFAPDGGSLFYASEQLRRIDLATGTVEVVPHPLSIGKCRKLIFQPGGKRAVLVGAPEGSECAVAVWESGLTAVSEWFLAEDYRTRVCVSPDGETVAVAQHTGRNKARRALTLRSVHDGKVLRELGSPDVRELLFSPDGRWLLVTSWGDGVSAWDTRTGKPVCDAPIRGADGPSFSPNGRDAYLFSESVIDGGGTADGGVRIHYLKFPGGRDMAYSLGFTTVSPDGQVLVAGIDGSLHFWTLPATGVNEWVKLRTMCDTFQKCAWSPDGRWLVTTGINGMIRMWPWPAVYEAARAAGA